MDENQKRKIEKSIDELTNLLIKENKKLALILNIFLAVALFIGFGFLAILLHQSFKLGKKEVLSEDYKIYEITHVNQPKRFTLDLKDVKTGQKYKSVYVSKYCQYWRNIEKNKFYTFKEITFKYTKENKIRTKVLIDGYNFCNRVLRDQ